MFPPFEAVRFARTQNAAFENYTTRFLNRLEELLEKDFTVAKLFPMLDQYETQLAAGAARDRKRWPGPAEHLHDGIAEVKGFIHHRRTFLQREIARLRRG